MSILCTLPVSDLDIFWRELDLLYPKDEVPWKQQTLNVTTDTAMKGKDSSEGAISPASPDAISSLALLSLGKGNVDISYLWSYI